MTDRDRPRLNITLDADLKKRAEDVADQLNLPLSRLIEDVLAEFLELYEEDPTVGVEVRKSVTDRKKAESPSSKEESAKEEIENILEAMEESDPKN
jgi:antitoxin component of RelBE/YafQ-DinJ toxin-antitoxin module